MREVQIRDFFVAANVKCTYDDRLVAKGFRYLFIRFELFLFQRGRWPVHVGNAVHQVLIYPASDGFVLSLGQGLGLGSFAVMMIYGSLAAEYFVYQLFRLVDAVGHLDRDQRFAVESCHDCLLLLLLLPFLYPYNTTNSSKVKQNKANFCKYFAKVCFILRGTGRQAVVRRRQAGRS